MEIYLNLIMDLISIKKDNIFIMYYHSILILFIYITNIPMLKNYYR